MLSSSSYQNINRNQLNKSSSKQIYAFPRQSRFKFRTQQFTSKTQFMRFPGFAQEMKKRGISFSRSKKQFKFENEQESKLMPPPNFYHIGESKKKDLGFSIAKKLKTLSILNPERTPGPAAYEKSLSSRNKSNLFGRSQKKLEYPLSNRVGLDAPGPYSIETGRLMNILSKYKAISGSKIHKITKKNQIIALRIRQHQQQLLTNRKKTLKQHSSSLNLNQNAMLANKGSNKSIVFGKDKKKSIFDISIKDKIPGPENYELFSEFATRRKPDELKLQSELQRGKSRKIQSLSSLPKPKDKLINYLKKNK